ncbi:zinc-binding protein A33-like [Ambystoma mexicanum]|uniref:zinc-binding protein A33-like n=1 Tax=Ambystoma mexicanum TaxID=8296 RepID=UPI0037E964A5
MSGIEPSSLDISEELLCPICLELFSDAVGLPCEHYFCQKCISETWAGRETYSCPQCRLLFPEPTYKPSRLLRNLVQRAKESLGKKDMGLGAAAWCDGHDEPLKLFCVDEGLPVCLVCRDAPKHAGHSFLPVQDAARASTARIQKGLGALRQKLQELQKCRRDQEGEMENVEGIASLYYHYISSEFTHMRQLLEEKEKKLKNKLKEEQDAALADMEANRNRLTEELQASQATIAELESQMLLQVDPVAFLQGMKILSPRAQQETAAEVLQREEGVPTVVSRALCPGRFSGPIQYKVWKEMSSCIQPAISPLTVDPKTAHPKLIVSEDCTSVMYTANKQQVPDSPRRFDTYLGTLASQGFTTGRHYWEVDVTGKPDWDVGLAAASAKKKGKVTAAVQNGYWAIWLRNGVQLTAQDSSPKMLLGPRVPQRLGMFLDYCKGQMSFYDAKDMSHIYTFISRFTEKVYPFFCTCSSAYGDHKPVTYFHPNY